MSGEGYEWEDGQIDGRLGRRKSVERGDTIKGLSIYMTTQIKRLQNLTWRVS